LARYQYRGQFGNDPFGDRAQAEQLLAPEPPPDLNNLAAQFLVLVTCRDEKDQVELLGQLKEEGRECKALLA
jgi:hypothetical protein